MISDMSSYVTIHITTMYYKYVLLYNAISTLGLSYINNRP